MLLHPCELFSPPSLVLSNLAPPNKWCIFVTESNVTLINLCLRSTGPLKKLFHYAIFQKFFHIFIIHYGL